MITIDNSTGAAAAEGVELSDPIPANTTFVGTNVDLTGLSATSCTADAADANGDGCSLDAGTLTLDASVIGDIAAGDTVTVAFQVTIN